MYATIKMNDLQLHETISKYLNLILSEKPSHERVFNLQTKIMMVKVELWWLK